MVGRLNFIFVKKNKGSALIIVLMIMSVGLLLSAILMNYTTTSYKRVLSDTNIDMAYYASESTMERVSDYIDNRINLISAPIAYSDDSTYALNVVNALNTQLGSFDFIEQVDVSNTETALSKVMRIDLLNDGNLLVGDELELVLGISVQTGLKKGIFQAGKKEVYYKKKVILNRPQRFELNYAINTIGDVMADGNSTPLLPSLLSEADLSKYNFDVNIYGNVNTYGSSPENNNIAEQWFYGGIMAKNNAYLNIQGTAYCRGLIRTGIYSRSATAVDIDRSRIDVGKDVVAQGIQVFGRDDKIVVYKDAYTFDDLEINGPNSVIAINGSYFGVSDGSDSPDHHDKSSAIVNSASIHDLSLNKDEAKRSRVVVNGDVFVNGGSFKLNTAAGSGNNVGSTIGEIENSSVAWDNGSNNIEMYRGYDYWDTMADEYLYEPFNIAGESYLEENKNNVNGYGSLFQVWSNSLGSISTWLDNIDTVRNGSDPLSNNLGTKVNDPISGYCKGALAANDTVKFIKTGGETSGIEKYSSFNNLDYPEEIKELEDFWRFNGGVEIPLNDVSIPWDEYATRDNDYSISRKLTALKTILIEGVKKYNAEFFVSRDDTSSDTIIHQPRPSKVNAADSYFKYLVDTVDVRSGSYPGRIVKVDPNNVVGNVTNLSLYSSEFSDPNTYYVFVCKDSNIEIVVDTNFNGIIVTMGDVRIGRGVTIKGSILACGSRYSNSIVGIDSSRENDLNNGEYAAVYFDGSLGVQTLESSQIIFDDGLNLTGREDLLNKIEANGGPNLRDIF